MDSNVIFFSSKFQTPILTPSFPPPSSTSRPLITRQFLGFTHNLWPPGGSSLRKKRQSLGFTRLQSPRFVIRSSIDSNLVLVVIGVTALSALSLAFYNQILRRSATSKKVSGPSRSALPQRREGKDVVIQTVDSQNLEMGDLQRDTFTKENGGFTKNMGEVNDASESREVLLQETTVANGDSLLAKASSKSKEALLQETTVVDDHSLLAKASESNGADFLAFNDNDSDGVPEESGTTDIPLQPTVQLESGAGQSLESDTERSELLLEEVERVNGFEADFPRLSIKPKSSTSSALVEDVVVLVGESEVTRSYDIFKESGREELHTFYKADQSVEKYSTNLNGLTLKPASSHILSPHTNRFSSLKLKLNGEVNRDQLSATNSLQTAEMIEGKVSQPYLQGGFSHKGKYFGRHREPPIDEEEKHLIQEKDTKLGQFSFPNGELANNKHHLEEHLSSYNRLLSRGRLSDCVDLLEDMEQRGLLDMDKVYHAKFFKICSRQKAVKEAFRFTKLILNPTLSTFNMLMSVCACSKDSEGAFQVLRLVLEAGFQADCKLYTTLTSTCAKSGKVDTMFEVFHEMVNAGVEPNVNTYGALIDGCARAGQVAKAFGAYGIMRSKNVKPDRVIFNALITACGQSGAVDRAFDVLAEMMAETQPIDPDHVTIGALIKACSNAGQVDRAREVYKMIQKFNIRGTPEVYTIAVNCCGETGDWEFACSVYNDMKKKGVAPDEVFVSALIDVAGHAGKLDAAFELVQEARNLGINTGIVSYSSLMGACSNARNWEKALELYENIKALKLKLTVSTVNALITSLCEANQLPKAMEVLSEMKKFGLSPNTITYSILLVASERNDDLEVGLMLLSKARDDGVATNLIMSRCIIDMCLRKFRKACTVGEPVLSFNSGRPHIENKWTSVALTVYRETINVGIVPTMEVVSKILGCLQLPCDDSVRSRLVENLEVTADPSRYSSLGSLIDGFGEYDPRAFSVLKEAASFGIVPCISFKESPIVVDAREMQINTAEVYLLNILKGLKHRLAAGAKLPSISILLPLEKATLLTSEGEKSIDLAGRIGQAIAALLRRMGLPYQGNESYGKIRINGLALRRWFQPKLASPFTGKPGEWNASQMRLGKGISHQQRNIRTGNLSLH
ncbi:pentatricopeptide repeat-containing protein MRL1, chloroplastic-like isoform X1 [Hibiscus syriacus]|uniref:pentatricopeptide repeat-containing protein MRL1, chloroplastic-like isoform X1 n=1 Tax=Hibiscus syriacus TaxID=106335 RepID=UPI0019228028|nr:pentatricopeptide repeat-containing protein MRL1, chloroplastic-like isoform X1 [Hibiscus syriacus]XP_039006353.1 pentatricopeptide repeat-containing protein MRL1, chloroplastic-like isoform X1 [Hibiscus syriacus]